MAMSQTNKIMNHLIDVGSITFLEAWTLYSVRSLPRRIKDLRERGFNIITEWRKDNNGQKYAKYLIGTPTIVPASAASE
jgi:hypothetical protein